MCGINSIVSWASEDLSMDIDRMNQSIIHRGPNDGGYMHLTKDEYSIGLGMRRLSILDLENSTQPMSCSKTGDIIVFNGEIYNFQELRYVLQTEHHLSFDTDGDTEVLLKGLQTFGESFIRELDGMFAFAYFSAQSDTLILGRDTYGEKPLYIYQDEKIILIASEIKSIKSYAAVNLSLNEEALSLYFSLTFIPAPHTIYNEVVKIERSSVVKIDLLKKSLIKYSYTTKISSDIKQDTIYNIVENSVRSRMISDVPLGAFLSGGVDSGIITGLASRQQDQSLDVFSVFFENHIFDESERIIKMADYHNCNLHSVVISDKDLLTDLEDVLRNFDQPFADSSAIPSALIMKHAAQTKKVILSGDGGDEMFYGYNKHKMFLMPPILRNMGKTFPLFLNYTDTVISKLQKSDNRGVLYKTSKFLKSITSSSPYINLLSLGMSEQELNAIWKKNNRTKLRNLYLEPSNIIEASRLDKDISLDGDLLPKVDMTSMFSSLEVRSPFLNSSIEYWSKSLPFKNHINLNQGKLLLRENFKDLFPANFLNAPKQGFGIPVGEFLRGPLKKRLYEIIELIDKEMSTIIDMDPVRLQCELHMNRRSDFTFQLWTIYCFGVWLEAEK